MENENKKSLKVHDLYKQLSTAMSIVFRDIYQACENVNRSSLIDHENAAMMRFNENLASATFRDLLHRILNEFEAYIAMSSENTHEMTDCFINSANIAYHRLWKDIEVTFSKSGWFFENVIVANAHLHIFKHRAVFDLSDAARVRVSDFDKQRTDDRENLGFLVWTLPHSGDDMDLILLDYMADAYIVSNYRYKYEIDHKHGYIRKEL